MISPIHSENDSFDSAYLKTSRSYSKYSDGLLLLEEAERAPEYLRLTIDSDVDEEDKVLKNESEEEDQIFKKDAEEYKAFENDTDSEEDVVLLGEKRPTYQEITLEEDEDGKVKECVIEKEKENPPIKEIKEPLYECPNCDKSFRVESLLKFHIQMHSSVASSLNSSTSDPSPSSSKTSDSQKLMKNKKKRHSSEKGESKLSRNLKLPIKQKNQRNKHKSHKKSKEKTSEHF